MKKNIALLCAVALTFSIFCIAIGAIKFNYTFGSAHPEGAELEKWINNNFATGEQITDNEYSFAFVGDTQYVTYADLRDGTDNLQKTYKWIADNVSSKNIAHVFALGDMTHMSYENDRSISYDQTYATGLGEWNIVKSATDQLKGKVPFSVVRGNHDDFQIDDVYGGDSDYTAQFGGFYRESSGVYKDSITNSWRTLDVHGDKYLFITIDFNTKPEVLEWAGDVIESHPDRKVIITTHGYLSNDGGILTQAHDTSSYKAGSYNGVDGKVIWEDLASKYENVIMVASGHVSASNVVYNFKEGDHGNQVLQVLIDPQSLDLDGAYTGLVCIMHFSDNGSKIQLEYYSPLLNMHKKGNDKIIDLNYKPVTSDESINVGGKINTTDLKAYGLELEYLGAPLSKPTTLNGHIVNGEYSYSRKVSKDDSTHLSGVWKDDITEYFGYDNNYVYYAFTTKFSGTPTVNIQFCAADTLMNAEDYSAYLARRAVFRFAADSDGVGIVQKDNWGTSKWNKDGFAGAYVNNGTHTYEFKVSISFLKSYYGVTSLDTVGMLVYLGLDDIGDEMWIRHNLSSEAVAVLRNSGVGTNPSGWIYRYFLLKTDPNPAPAPATSTAQATTTAQPILPTNTTTFSTSVTPPPKTDRQTTAQTTTSTEAETTPITPDTQTNTTPPTTTVATVAESNGTTGGCSSRLNLSVLVIFPTIALSAFILSKKRKSE